VTARIIYCAIFLSGFASLGYELCWIRKGSLLIGATPQALSIVVAIFFGGMAAGAYLSGLFSRRTDKLLLWYGILECTIGLMAAITPELFGLAGEAYARVYHFAEPGQGLHILLRSGLVAVLILPCCLAMGGTLPLLCQFFISSRKADMRFAAGKLYAVNTGGAFCGCILCGVWLIPVWGINASIWFNALLSFAAGAVIIQLSRTISSSPVETVPSAPVPVIPAKTLDISALTRCVVYGLFFCAGFAALGYEILWVRFLSLIIHNTVYTTVFSLGAVLLGIVVGGILVCVVKNSPKHDVHLFAAVNIFMGFCVLSIMLLPAGAWDWISGTRSVPMQSLLCLVIILIPSIASGMSFPLAYRLVAVTPINSGRDFGFLTAVNTVGGITGSLLVGFYLLPELGMYRTLLFLTLISLLIGICTITFFVDAITWFSKRIIIYVVTAVLSGIVLFSGSRLPADFLANKQDMVEFAEGISSFISVVMRDGDKTLEIDRMWQGVNQKGHQILASHIPMILHQNPKNVLVIGMGTGQAAQRFLMYDINRLDCVDIEKTLPGILTRHFDADWLSDPRTRIIIDDGRNFTAYTEKKYDIVSIEVGQSFRPQVALFYTVDFYREVSKRLAKKGLVCQFVPVGFFTHEEFRAVVRSFLEVFPQSTLWFNRYAECILVGNTTRQPKLSTKRVGLLRSDRVIRADLDYSFEGTPWLLMNKKEVFAANFLMGPRKLAELAGDASPYFDDRPILEYQTARNLYSRKRFHALLENHLESPETIFEQKISITSEIEISRIRAETVHESLK
jgi:spermidine synthase